MQSIFENIGEIAVLDHIGRDLVVPMLRRRCRRRWWRRRARRRRPSTQLHTLIDTLWLLQFTHYDDTLTIEEADCNSSHTIAMELLAEGGADGDDASPPLMRTTNAA